MIPEKRAPYPPQGALSSAAAVPQPPAAAHPLHDRLQALGVRAIETLIVPASEVLGQLVAARNAMQAQADEGVVSAHLEMAEGALRQLSAAAFSVEEA